MRRLIVMAMGLVCVGAAVLRLGVCLQPGRALTWVEAVFTATSAATTTGLTVQDTASHFTPVGLAVIAVLMQVGALAAMVVACRLLLGDLPGLTRRIVVMVLAIEAVGALLLMPTYGVAGGVFHAISGFCNVGFDVTGESMAGERYAMSTHVVMTALIVLGGLGLPVLMYGGRRRHVRVVLAMTAALYAAGVLVIVLGQLMAHINDRLKLNVTANRPEPAKLTASAVGTMVADASFLAVSARSAGFYTTAMDQVTPAGSAAVMGLMLVGGSPGSATGGMHVTTLAVLLAALCAAGRRREALDAAAKMAMLFGAAIFAATLLLSLVEPFAFDRLLFETISAATLCGLSQGVTAELTTFGKCVIVASMWIGRVAPLMLVAKCATSGDEDGVYIG